MVLKAFDNLRPKFAAIVVIIGLNIITFSATARADTFTVTKTSDSNDGLCSADDCSFREAVIAANQNPGLDIVVLSQGTFGLTITGILENAAAKGDIDLTDDVEIRGAGEAFTLLEGNEIDRVLQVIAGVTATIKDLTIRGGSVSSPYLGGGLLNQGTASLERVRIEANQASNGGGMGNDGGIALLDSVTMMGNQAVDSGDSTGYGGAVFNCENGALEITDSTIEGNQADHDGGGIYNIKGDIHLTRSNIKGNVAIGSGGGVATLDRVTLDDSTVQENTGNDGGGIASFPGSRVSITESSLTGNSADGIDFGGGGALFNYQGHVEISSSDLTNNQALGEGGGAVSSSGTLIVLNSTITNNAAPYYSPNNLPDTTSPGFGGGLLLIKGGTVFLMDSTISGNTAGVNGGGIYNDQASSLIMMKCLVNNNSVTHQIEGLYGGGIYNDGDLTLTRSTVKDNSAIEIGGGIMHAVGAAYVVDSVVTGNSANNAGGIGNFRGGKLSVARSTISDNIALIQFGGALLNDAGSKTVITNSTITGNSAGVGGAISNNNSINGVTLENVTITGNIAMQNGDALFNWNGKVTMKNSIIDGDCYWDMGSTGQVISEGGNLESPGNTCGLVGPGDQVSVPDPLLEPLADNGGNTPTHALDWQSEAIDRGLDGSCLQSDQLGANRTVDGDNDGIPACDVGAFEYGGAAPGNDDQTIPALIVRYYNDILNRAPDASGVTWWQDQIERVVGLGISINEGFIAVAKVFFNSAEYLKKGRTDEEYVVDLYGTFFEREPTLSEINFWVDCLLNGMSRNTVLNQFMFSTEFNNYMSEMFGIRESRPENNLVNDFYRGFHSRLPDIGGFLYWIQKLRAAQCAGDAAGIRELAYQIASLFISLSEYQNRNRDSSGFAEDLYDGIMRRAPDPGGFSFWVGKLEDGSKTRAQVLAFFTESEEFQRRVQEVIDAGCY